MDVRRSDREFRSEARMGADKFTNLLTNWGTYINVIEMRRSSLLLVLRAKV